MSHHHSWIESNLKPILKLVGSVIATIGAIILISAGLKLALPYQNPATDFYLEQSCRDQLAYNKLQPEVPTEVNPADLQKCLDQHTKNEVQRENKRRLEQSIDGLAFLITGIALVMFNLKSKKSS